MSFPLSQLKPSLTIEYNNEPHIILECEHAKLARGSSFVRAKIKNLINSQLIDCTLRDSDKINQAFIEQKKLLYSYKDGFYYHFINAETYEDFILHKDKIEDKIGYLKENLELSGLFYKNKLINLELPITVTLKVTETEPGFKGDTRKAGTKPAKMETGLTINVPLFIKNEDCVKIDTRNRQYLERA